MWRLDISFVICHLKTANRLNKCIRTILPKWDTKLVFNKSYKLQCNMDLYKSDNRFKCFVIFMYDNTGNNFNTPTKLKYNKITFGKNTILHLSRHWPNSNEHSFVHFNLTASRCVKIEWVLARGKKDWLLGEYKKLDVE